MKSNLEKVMDLIFIHEGGYAERDSEPGGAVNMGISFTAFKDWWKKSRHPGEPSFADLKGLTRAEAESIYHKWFFEPISFDVLPSGVDYALVDLAVNSGLGGAIRAVRKQMKFAPGLSKMDAKFLWALRMRDPDEVIDAICDARLALMMSSSKWPRFEKNWSGRVKKVRDRAHEMAAKEID